MRAWIRVALVVGSVLLPTQATAQSPAAAPPAQQAEKPSDGTVMENRFIWDYKHIGVSRLFPEFEQLAADGSIDELTLFRAASGEMGSDIQARFKEAAAWPAFKRCAPGGSCERLPEFRLAPREKLEYKKAYTAYWDEFVQRLQASSWQQVEYRVGPDGSNTELNAPLCYGVAIAGGKIVVKCTKWAPKMVGFNAKAIKVSPITLTWGPHKDYLFSPVIITAFGKPGASEYSKLGCGNLSGQFSRPIAPPPPAPKPAAPPLPPPPPPPPPPDLCPNIAGIQPEVPMGMIVDRLGNCVYPEPPPPPPPPALQPPPAPMTTSLTVRKIFTDRNHRPKKKLPRNWERMEFSLQGPAPIAGTKPEMQKVKVTFSDGDKQYEHEAVDLVYRNIAFGHNDSFDAEVDVVETRGVVGYADETRRLRVNVPAAGSVLENTEPARYYNIKKPCRLLKLPCVAWVPIAAAAAIPFFIHGDDKPGPPNQPTKTGGPGQSPPIIIGWD